jgi:hypothetical protein
MRRNRADIAKKCARFRHRTFFTSKREIHFVDQGGRLKGVAPTLPCLVTACEAPELVVCHEHELLECGLISLAPRHQEPDHIETIVRN